MDNSSSTSSAKVLFIEDILKILPHRYPVLFLDRLEDIVPFESATGIKNVTINEEFFLGHFPKKPVMPGVFIIEALAQTAGALVMTSSGYTQETHEVYFMSISEARFRKPIYPGNTIHLKVQKQQHRSTVWKFQGTAFVNGEICAEASYSAMISSRSSK